MVRLLVILLLFQANASLAQSFTATVSKSKVAVGERFNLKFSLDRNGSRFSPPDLSDFQVLSGPNQSTSMQWINGNSSYQQDFSYVLVSTKEGDYVIGPAQVKADGEMLKSNSVSISVVGSVKKTQPTQPAQAQSQQQSQDINELISTNLFMKLFLDKKQAYVGEQVIATYKLYINAQVVDYNVKAMPVFNGFYANEVEIPNGAQMSEEIINGQRFTVATIKKMVLTPQSKGQLEVPNFEMDMTVRVQEKRRQRGFFDQFFGSYRNVKVTVSSNTGQIEVLPLPKGTEPKNFAGAVGDFTITANMDKTEIKANEAINFNVTIEGNGNLNLIGEPNLEFPADFEHYEPKVKENIAINGAGIRGSKTFEYVLIPRYSGQYEVEPIKFSFFNLSTKSYKTVSTPSFKISVSKSENASEENAFVSAINKEEVRLLGKDLRFIKTEVPAFDEPKVPLLFTPQFYGLTALPVAGIGLSLLLFSFVRSRNADVIGLKKRKATSKAEKRLKVAAKKAGVNTAEAYQDAYAALTGFVSDKLNIPTASLSKEQIVSSLNDQQVSPDISKQLIAQLDMLEMAQYAPQAVGTVSDVIDKTKSVINLLDDAV